jgi:predicted transcriptional regulator
MEDAGLVSTKLEESPRGPRRKEYILKKSVSMTIDLAPNLFRARVFSFGNVPGLQEGEEGSRLSSWMNDFPRYPGETAKLRPLAQIIAEVDRKLKDMEEERAVLLYLRNLALREAARASTSLESTDRRKVLKFIMKEQWDSIGDVSSSLGLRQQVVGDILEEIERELTPEQ